MRLGAVGDTTSSGMRPLDAEDNWQALAGSYPRCVCQWTWECECIWPHLTSLLLVVIPHIALVPSSCTVCGHGAEVETVVSHCLQRLERLAGPVGPVRHRWRPDEGVDGRPAVPQ